MAPETKFLLFSGILEWSKCHSLFCSLAIATLVDEASSLSPVLRLIKNETLDVQNASLLSLGNNKSLGFNVVAPVVKVALSIFVESWLHMTRHFSVKPFIRHRCKRRKAEEQNWPNKSYGGPTSNDNCQKANVKGGAAFSIPAQQDFSFRSHHTKKKDPTGFHQKPTKQTRKCHYRGTKTNQQQQQPCLPSTAKQRICTTV